MLIDKTRANNTLIVLTSSKINPTLPPNLEVQMGNERMTVEGEPGPRFHVYQCDLKGDPVICLAKYHTIAEVHAHRWRRDMRYKILVDRKPMTMNEFLKWAKTQEGTS